MVFSIFYISILRIRVRGKPVARSDAIEMIDSKQNEPPMSYIDLSNDAPAVEESGTNNVTNCDYSAAYSEPKDFEAGAYSSHENLEEAKFRQSPPNAASDNSGAQ